MIFLEKPIFVTVNTILQIFLLLTCSSLLDWANVESGEQLQLIALCKFLNCNVGVEGLGGAILHRL